MPKPEQSPATQTTLEGLDLELAALSRRSAGAREELTQVAARQQDALFKDIATALNLDLEARANKIMEAHRGEREAAEEAVRKLREETRDLVRRQSASFEEKLRDLRKSGFAKAIEKACHNPRLLMKLCFDWDADGSPPPGMTGVSNNVDWDFETIDDPRFGAFIDRIHAHAGADAGDRHYENAQGDVNLNLRFSHPPRPEQTVAEQISVDLTAFGYIESNIATDMYGSLTRATSAGGYAELSAAVTIAQDFTWPSGLRGTNRLEVGLASLAHCVSRGAIFMFGPFPIPLGGAPCWQRINVRDRLTFSTVFPIYGRTNPREPHGDDVRVEVQLRLHTNARGESANASIDFRRSEGYSIRIPEVIVHTAD